MDLGEVAALSVVAVAFIYLAVVFLRQRKNPNCCERGCKENHSHESSK